MESSQRALKMTRCRNTKSAFAIEAQQDDGAWMVVKLNSLYKDDNGLVFATHELREQIKDTIHYLYDLQILANGNLHELVVRKLTDDGCQISERRFTSQERL
jgi:hypothetical protein